MARAKELLDLVRSPTAVATAVLLAFTTSQLKLNDEGTIDSRRTFWALVSAVLGTLLAAAVVAVMTPLALRVAIGNWGNEVESRLLVYVLTYLVAIGTTVYGLSVVNRALLHKGLDLWFKFRGEGS
jgi:nitrogen fixation/metabolism regulation signal transduction histidine kinase